MNDETKLIYQRLKEYPPDQLEVFLRQYKNELPSTVQVVQRIENKPILGKCVLLVLTVGSREFVLRISKFTGTVKNPFGKGEFDRFEELKDEFGNPLFTFEDAKEAVLIHLSKPIAGHRIEDHPEYNADKQNGLQLWNKGETWMQACKAINKNAKQGDEKAFSQEIKRYAIATDQTIRKGSPGLKLNRNK